MTLALTITKPNPLEIAYSMGMRLASRATMSTPWDAASPLSRLRVGGATWSRSARIVKIASAPPAAPSSQVQLGPHVSGCRIARRDDPRRAVDHHRPLAGAVREGGTNRGRGAGADVVGLISERARQRADLERQLHRVVDRRVPRPPLAEWDGSIEWRDSDIGEAGRR